MLLYFQLPAGDDSETDPSYENDSDHSWETVADDSDADPTYEPEKVKHRDFNNEDFAINMNEVFGDFQGCTSGSEEEAVQINDNGDVGNEAVQIDDNRDVGNEAVQIDDNREIGNGAVQIDDNGEVGNEAVQIDDDREFGNEALTRGRKRKRDKDGDKPKRRPRKSTEAKKEEALEREHQKRMKLLDQHPVREGCPLSCNWKCCESINEAERIKINEKYWNLDFEHQKRFILDRVTKSVSKRTTVNTRRESTFQYTIRKQTGEVLRVCKLFFLTTLGYKKTNDTVLKILRKVSPTDQSVPEKQVMKDGRGKYEKELKYDHDAVRKHIESYGPAVPHYRREHAPNRRYLPSDITIKDMYDQHIKHNEQNKTMTYNLFYQIFKTMNISMTKLGNEECETCTRFAYHKSACDCDTVCSKYTEYIRHFRKLKQARLEYERQVKLPKNDAEIYVAVDLQKVIMLPRMNQFKEAIFTRRLTVFNETFAGLGSRKNFATIWHEAISGRNDEDIASSYYTFLTANCRDAERVTIWADNCTAQNKNWTIFTMLAYLVNSNKIAAKSITINYFEPGHTFMAADSVHAEVENQMKRKQKVYDFEDFSSCVTAANCITYQMKYDDFRA